MTSGNITYFVSDDGPAGCSRVCRDLEEVNSARLGRLEEPGLTTTPLLNIHPTMVVPVLVAFGKGTPLACNAALRL